MSQRRDARLTSRELLIIRRAKPRRRPPFFPPPIPLPHFGGNYFCWRAVCDVYLPTGGWNDSKSEFEDKVSPRESPFSPSSHHHHSLSLSLFRARARFWRNCFFVLAFPPFDPRFPDSSSFPSFYPSPVCPIAIVRDESRVEKKKRKEKEGEKIFKSFPRSFARYPRCMFVRCYYCSSKRRGVIRYPS